MSEISIGMVLFLAGVVWGFVYLVRRGRRTDGKPSGKPRPRSMASLNKLEKLQQLRDKGALSEAEYEAEKAKVLS